MINRFPNFMFNFIKHHKVITVASNNELHLSWRNFLMIVMLQSILLMILEVDKC